MTGPEHYREAERLIVTDDQSWPSPDAIARAQVHATLALAAATALTNGVMPTVDLDAWKDAASEGVVTFEEGT